MNYRGIILVGVIIAVTACVQQNVIVPQATTTDASVQNATATQTLASDPLPVPAAQDWQSPLDRLTERVTKKFFATKVSPINSPVQPERFSGYHTAIDFETFSDEVDTVVTVKAVCTGKLLQRRTATGYGGVVVQACTYNNQPVTVIYGHLDINSVIPKIGATIQVGQALGNLGKGFSSQTDGERKHLHLGIHKGSTGSILGYVTKQSDLSAWIDPLTILNKP
jgi:hypothetical protein